MRKYVAPGDRRRHKDSILTAVETVNGRVRYRRSTEQSISVFSMLIARWLELEKAP